MNYTWGEIQILAIQKMFLNNVPITNISLDTLRTDRKYQLYMDSMPGAANEGLLRLMSVGKPLIKKYSLTYDIPDEIYDYATYETKYVVNDDLIIHGKDSLAVYFEINNNATIEIQQFNTDWETIRTINHIANISGTFETYKELISNDEQKEIRIKFKSNKLMYAVRNIAMYNIGFATEDDIYNHTQKQKYDLSVLIPDFYEIISVEYEKDNLKGKFNSDFMLEGNSILSIDSNLKGNFIITYKAYAAKITASTSNTYRFNLPGEMTALLPLYIASELYKDDDISQATIYRNEFEVALQELNTIEEPQEFANNSNWF